ncbi:MAG: hypothetical protein JKY42_01800 [Flavobacteriales bacterium]|nr:hypothetical protein [Flavobacteriales bacterium]
MKNLFFIILSLLCVSLDAQNGYLGKETLIKYEIGLSPSLVNPTVNYDMGLNTIHQVSIEYAVGSKTSLGVAYSYNRTGIRHDSRIQVDLSSAGYSGINYNTYYNYTIHNPDFKGTMSVNEYSIFLNHFRNNHASFLGRFGQLKFTWVRYNVDVEKSDLEIAGNLDLSDYYEYEKPNSAYPARFVNNYAYNTIRISYGRYFQRILFSSLPVYWGYAYGWTAGGYISSDIWNQTDIYSDIIGFDIFRLNGDNYIKHGAHARLSSQGFLNLKLGLGLLPI